MACFRGFEQSAPWIMSGVVDPGFYISFAPVATCPAPGSITELLMICHRETMDTGFFSFPSIRLYVDCISLTSLTSILSYSFHFQVICELNISGKTFDKKVMFVIVSLRITTRIPHPSL